MDPNKFEASYEAFLEAIHPDDRERVNNAYLTSLKSKEPYVISHRIVHKDGRLLYVEERCETGFDSDGTPIKSRGTVQDITENIILRQELQESNANIQNVLNNIPDVTLKVNRLGEITFANDVAKKVLGYSTSELIGNKLNLILPDNIKDDHQKYIDSYFKNPGVRRMGDLKIDFKAKRKDGSLLDVVIALGGLISENEVLAIIKDNTEEVKKRQLLEKEVLAKNEFLTIVGHETKTPLLGALGKIDQIIHSSNDKSIKKNAEEIKSLLTRILNSNNNIINTQFLKQENYALTKRTFSLPSIIDKIIDEQKICCSSNIKFKIKHSKNLNIDIQIHTDKNLLSAILSPLIDNAVKFSENKPVTILIENPIGKTLSFSVSDHGHGMNSSLLQILNNPEIVEIHQKDREVIPGSLKGFGLGLSIAKAAAKKLGVRLYFTRSEEIVTTVTFSVPNSLMKDAPKEKQIVKNKNILIVDDIAINRNIQALMLKNFNHQIDFAENGLEAFEKCQSNDYDLILMDIQMPVMSGDEALKSIRKFKPEQKIIAATADGSALDSNKYISFGFNDFLAKPFTKEILSKTIASVF